MTEFSKFPPKVSGANWNALLDHGLEKPCSFIIFKRTIDGTDYYYAQYGTGADQAGKIAFGGPGNAGNVNGTDASAVINAAVNALGDLPTTGAPGTIFVKKGTYDISSDITIGKKTHLIGESGAIFNVTSTLTNGAIVIDPTDLEWCNWWIENIHINLNLYGNGIYCEWTGKSNSQQHVIGLRNVLIRNVGAGYAGIFFYNPFYMVMDNIRILFNYGTGIKIRQRATSPYRVTGNSHFREIYVAVSSNGAIGVDIEGDGIKDPASLCQWDRLQVIGSGSLTDTICLRIKKASHNSVFNALDTEEYALTGVYLEDCSNVAFINPFVVSGIANHAFQFVGNTDYIYILNPKADGCDDDTDGTKQILIEGGYIWGEVSNNGSLKFINVGGYKTANSGTATIAAGATYVDVTHGLAITPDINRIKVTPKDDLSGRSFWVSNVTATTFRINISSSDTVNHTFGWSYE